MAPNPISIPRKPLPRPASHQPSRRDQEARSKVLTTPHIVTAATVLLAVSTSWARRWLLSGAAIETVLLVYGDSQGTRILSFAPLWVLIAALNLSYFVCSTSWLLLLFFTLACYPILILTCLFQFPVAAKLARRSLRKVLGQHFIRDQIALFNLPALEIDTDVDGLFVIRGVTLSVSNLTLVAHGIELGLKLADDIELAIYVDQVTVRLFRRIDIGDVYTNIKGGKFEMTFGEMDDPKEDTSSEMSVFLDNTPLLKAANAGGKSFRDRPTLRTTLTGGVPVQDSSAQASLNLVKTIDPDDEKADKLYRDALKEIHTTSAIYASSQQVQQQAKDKGIIIDDELDMRACVSAELHKLPSVPHPPQRSVRVTTLQNLSPPSHKRFMHRLPFLLRLLLAPLSYFHPISIDSINAAGSGKWLSSMLNQQVFKQYTENNSELRRLHSKITRWTSDANFCLQLTDITGLAQVPLSTTFDIITYLKFDEVIAFRTALPSTTPTQVVRLGGADATFSIPSYLLPHHEHIIPPVPTRKDEQNYAKVVVDHEGTPKAVQAENDLEKLQKDEGTVEMSVHASLPATCDQSLLNFIAALVKATKIIEMEKEFDEASDRSDTPISPVSPPFDDSDAESVLSVASSTFDKSGRTDLSLRDIAGFKMLARNIRQNLSDGTTKNQMKDFAKDLTQSTKSGMKKALVGGLVNDRWIAKMVGKVATALRSAQGDVGYSGNIPVPLAPYRATAELPSKLLP